MSPVLKLPRLGETMEEGRIVAWLVEAGAEVRARPDARAPVIARFDESARLLLTAQSGDFERVNLGGGRPGWVASGATSEAQGQVAEQGTHAELLERGGLYARLHALQNGYDAMHKRESRTEPWGTPGRVGEPA